MLIDQCDICKERSISHVDLKVIFLCPSCPAFDQVGEDTSVKLNENHIEALMEAMNCSRAEAVWALKKHGCFSEAFVELRLNRMRY